MAGELALHQLVEKGTVELGPEERAVRLRRDERRDLREHHLLYVVTGCLLVVGAATLWVALAVDRFDAETRSWARGLFMSLASAGAFFLVGRRLQRDRAGSGAAAPGTPRARGVAGSGRIWDARPARGGRPRPIGEAGT